MCIQYNAKYVCVTLSWWASRGVRPLCPICWVTSKTTAFSEHLTKSSPHPPWPTSGDSAVSWQLLRLACGQVMCQRHLSHLQAKDSPVSNSQRNNHLPGPFFQPKTASNKHLLNLMRYVDYRHKLFNNLSACRHHPGILLIAQGKEQHIGPTLSKVR